MPQVRTRAPSPRQRGNPRKRTLPIKRMTREFLRIEWLRIEDLGGESEEEYLRSLRPQTRADCVDGCRPCPWVSCKHHLYLDINPVTGSITINFPDLEPWEIPETCSLDGAEKGGMTLEEVGDYLNITRERVRQIETRALVTVKFEAKRLEMDEIEIGISRLTPLAQLAEDGGRDLAPSSIG